MSHSQSLLEIRDLSVRYEDGTMGLSGLDLSVEPGGRIALLGPNGSGKTTLLLTLVGALGFEGLVRLGQTELGRKTRREFRSRCGLVFANPDDQLFMPTLLADVAFGPANQGFSAEQAAQRAREAIAAVGLAGLDQRSGHHLSSGQKRAAAIATILAMQVDLLLLDEPTVGLDARSRRRIVELLEDRPETLLLATHDLDLAARLCDSAAILQGGRCAAFGPIEQILSDREYLAQVGLI